MGIVGTSDINKLIIFAKTLCILLIRFTPNTVVVLINIKGTVVMCLLAFAVFLL